MANWILLALAGVALGFLIGMSVASRILTPKLRPPEEVRPNYYGVRLVKGDGNPGRREP